MCGPALPVACTPGDNLAVHVALTVTRRGDVLCVSVGDERELGYWGEVLTTAAETCGVAGLVIDGCVRDVTALEAHRFGVFATGIALTGATKSRPGSIGRPASVGDVLVRHGDVVIGDRDGVAVIPAGELDAVLVAARARAATEADMFAQLRGGRTTVELLALDTSPIDVDLPGP